MTRAKRLPPIHPGEILLEEFLKPLGMSMNKLAEKLHVPANRITQIVEGWDRRARRPGANIPR
jgi:addiction module HigA family antidote